MESQRMTEFEIRSTTRETIPLIDSSEHLHFIGDRFATESSRDADHDGNEDNAKIKQSESVFNKTQLSDAGILEEISRKKQASTNYHE